MESIINKAYRLFKNYKTSESLDVCTIEDCCMKKANEVLLRSLSVNNIPKDLLQEYNDGASSGKTPIDELKHFLPRYFELISQFQFPSHSVEIALRRLKPFFKEEWSSKELEFLLEFSKEFFKYCLSIYPLPEYETIDSILLMFWYGQFQIENLLDVWKYDISLSSTLHFKDLYMRGFKITNSDKMNNAFAEKEISQVLRDWVDNKEVQLLFKTSIEEIIINDLLVDTYQSDELNILYEILYTNLK